jgi:AcrR family transcriptional regulator
MSGNANAAAPQKIDRRVARTRDVLGDAIVALIQEKPFDSITVQQVLDRTQVARSTFYTHYRDTNDLFLSDAEDFWEKMTSMLARQRGKSNRVAAVRELFSHVAEWRKFHSAMVKSEKLRDVLELGQGYFARSIAERLAAFPQTRSLSAARRAALGHAHAGAMFSLLTWWLSHGAETTAEQMDEMFHCMVWSGIGVPQANRPARGSSR